MVVITPNHANAFWFFSIGANAAPSLAISNPPTPTLKAATNIDPNPSKGLGNVIQTSGNAMLAYSGPSGTIADVMESTPPSSISVYVVRPGDTLSEIARMFRVSVNTLVWANNLRSVHDIRIGKTLVILPISGIERTIKKGDTLKSIAKKYRGTVNEIAQYNGLNPKESLLVGSSIIIPGGEEIRPVRRSSKRYSYSHRVIREPFLGDSGPSQPGYYRNPVPGGIITQGIHGWNAVDIAARRGTPIYAAASGTIIISRRNGAWNGGYGNYVVITHSNGTQTLYAHMTRPTVSQRQYVSAGQKIGYVGSTGKSTGAHVHFEVRGAANPFRNCIVGRACYPKGLAN